MKKCKIALLFLIPFLCLYFATTSFGRDTDIYMSSGQGVEPNILIIFDNSISMNEEVSTNFYDPSTLYPESILPQSQRNVIYYKTDTGDIDNSTKPEDWAFFVNSSNDVACTKAKSPLDTKGIYIGYTDSTCKKNRKTLATGNYINYLGWNGGDAYQPKLHIAKSVISDFLTSINDVKVGVMVFNSSTGNAQEYICEYGRYEWVTEYEGGHIQSPVVSLTDAGRDQLKTDINAIVGNTYTPLAETLYEAGLYYKGEHYFDPISHPSPIEFSCQKNYVIIITDGNSTRDQNPILATMVGDYDKDGRDPGYCSYDSGGTDYLDDVAKKNYDEQNIITYTIGFTIKSDLLERTATNGHGRYFYSATAQDLSRAFTNIVEEILAKSTSFVAPIVPVSRMERTTAGDKIYLALFKPAIDKMWRGNIKKYGVAQKNYPTGCNDYDIPCTIHVGDVVDSNGLLAIDSNGKFLEASISYWNPGQDGGEVEKGGVGAVLLKRTTARNIYTYFPAGGKKDLTDLSNAFTIANSSITLGVLGLAPTDPPDATKDQQKRDALINYVHGYDAYKDESADATKKRSWILGSFLHSRPFLINYKTRSVIFGGANDGMLHAFDDSDGRELWGFIPPNLLNKLQYLRTGEDVLFVDGSPKAYVTYDASNNVTSAILIFGERRGGNRYYALDVTDPEIPKYLWDIGPDTKVGETFPYEKMGQSWSSPTIGKIACEGEGTCIGGKRTVAFIGGGYDNDNQDKEKPYTSDSDSKGTAVYVLDISDGSLIKRFSNAELATMTYSLPSDITKVDLNGDGLVERLYVGDMGGRMWRFDIIGKDTSKWEGKIIFKSNPDGATTNLRKIFYPPDVTLELDDAGKGDFEMLFFGTGDREHPNDKVIINRLYGLKDRNLRDKTSKTGYIEGDLVDLTSDLLQDPSATAEAKSKLLFDLKEKNGWYIALPTGEKSLATPVVFYKTAYYTTFAPAPDAPEPGTDPCYVGEGTAWVYAVNYQLGTAVFDFNLTTVLEKSDRSKQIGTAIPSGVIITIVNNEATAYVGVGGGVFSPRLPNRNSIIPVNWRIVF